MIDEKLTIFWDDLTTTLLATLLNAVNAIVAVLCIAAIGYILYHCVCIMFFQKEIYVQKIIFGYFALLLFRILGALIGVGLK